MSTSSRPGQSSKPSRVTRLEVVNWKNFTHVKMDLAERVFLVGPNASGKSNLLDALRFLRDISRQGGGLQEAIVGVRGGFADIRCLAARKQPAVGLTICLGTDEEPKQWVYELTFNMDKKLKRPVVERERVEHLGQTILERPKPEDMSDRTLLTQTHLEQISANRQFRPIAEFLASIQYRHLVPQIVREPERWRVSRPGDPFGGDFLAAVAATPKRTRDARLRKIAAALRIAAPQLQELEVNIEHGVPHLRGRYAHWRPRGAWHDENQFSDGTLRLLGLLWSLLEKGGPLLLEEPELSLHPEIVRRIPQMIHRMQRSSRRQALITTHSADLLNDDGIGLDEVFLLIPGKEGTVVKSPRDFAEVPDLLEGDVPLGEAIVPLTAPEGADQLVLFPDLGER